MPPWLPRSYETASNMFMDKYHKRARLGEILLKSKTITGEQ
jgi:hypothetical protein